MLANVSSDANEKARDVLALLMTTATTTLEVFASHSNDEESKVPLGVLTSTNESALCWLKDSNMSTRRG